MSKQDNLKRAIQGAATAITLGSATIGHADERIAESKPQPSLEEMMKNAAPHEKALLAITDQNPEFTLDYINGLYKEAGITKVSSLDGPAAARIYDVADMYDQHRNFDSSNYNPKEAAKFAQLLLELAKSHPEAIKIAIAYANAEGDIHIRDAMIGALSAAAKLESQKS